MNAIYAELQKRIPIRTRVAFVLAVAEKVSPALERDRDALNAATQALTNGWRWEQGEAISSVQLHEENDEALVLHGCLVKENKALAAMMAATSAFYYMLWHAYNLDLKFGKVRQGEVPNIGEVSEETTAEVCRYAGQSTLCDEDWLNALIKQVVKDYPTDNPRELGMVVPRQYFQRQFGRVAEPQLSQRHQSMEP